jgi:hypothetical protein
LTQLRGRAGRISVARLGRTPARHLAVLLVGLTFFPAVARADGDPASDVLYFDDVFISYEQTSKPMIAKLEHETAVARAQARPIKVAVIWAKTDMGAVPLLYNKPDTYAKFLAAELGGILTGPLLIVMPSGFGLSVKHAKLKAATQALASVPFHAGTVDELTQTATAAVRKLRLSLAPRSGDARAPRVHALATSAKLGTKKKLRFRVSDNRGKVRALVRVYGTQYAYYALFASLSMPLRTVGERGSIQSVIWRVPPTLGGGKFRFCVLATDRAGNASKTSCAALILRRA